MMASVDSKSLDSLGIKVLVAEDNSQDSIIAEHFYRSWVAMLSLPETEPKPLRI